MLDFDAIAERRILEAIERGELDRLPGAGRPLDLDADALVPAEVRVANRVLKNAGLVPAEVLERRELAELERAAAASSPGVRPHALARLALLRARLEARGRRRGHALRAGCAARIVALAGRSGLD